MNKRSLIVWKSVRGLIQYGTAIAWKGSSHWSQEPAGGKVGIASPRKIPKQAIRKMPKQKRKKGKTTESFTYYLKI
jgi:hypothetical protein